MVFMSSDMEIPDVQLKKEMETEGGDMEIEESDLK